MEQKKTETHTEVYRFVCHIWVFRAESLNVMLQSFLLVLRIQMVSVSNMFVVFVHISP
jgi:hypothetical protein